MVNPFIGQITIFAGNFAPRSFAFCDGQLQSIAQNSALFSILGTTYGGDGRTTFALPDLRGRVAVGPRRGPGLSTYVLGEMQGIETVTLNLLHLPSHTHQAQVTGGTGTLTGSMTATINTNTSPGDASSDNTFIANNDGGDSFATAAGSTSLNAGAMTIDTSGLGVALGGFNISNSYTGGSQWHENRRPFLAINYIIALFGTYPSRS